MQIDSARELKARLMASAMKPLEEIAESGHRLGIAARAVTRLESTPRTIALGIAPHTRSQVRLAIRVQNRALENSPEVAAIVKQAKGEVEMRYVGRIAKRAEWYRSRQRPLLIGASVGHFNVTAGSIGCFVQMRRGRAVRLLSNNHVLADENLGKKGDAILQQGVIDGGTKARNTIGTLDRFVRLSTTKPNLVDCALAAINPSVRFDTTRLRDLAPLALTGLGPDVVDTGFEVAKVGRTTGATRGRVTAFELDNVVVGYDIGNLTFDNQIEMEGLGDEPFSLGGDSGAVIVDTAGDAIALLFAGGDQGGTNGKGLTYGNPIRTVLDALKADLLLI